MRSENPMLSLLGAAAIDAKPESDLKLFGQFVGSWDLKATFIDDGIESHTTGEWHFDWILQRRALQDVLIFPAPEVSSEIPSSNHRMGTSVRFYDGEAGTWRVVWINPSSGTMYKLTGGKVGDEIVLDGDPNDGEPTKWIFSEISDSSFLWRGLVSEDGETWELIQEMRANRQERDSGRTNVYA